MSFMGEQRLSRVFDPEPHSARATRPGPFGSELKAELLIDMSHG
jgi:hypothetical protein